MRVPGWEDAVLAVFERHRSTPYAAGTADCFVMAMDTVEALTGVRPYRAVKYKTDRGALVQLKRHGFSRLREAIAALYAEIPRATARRGDIAVLNSDRGDTLGIVWGGVIICRLGDGIKQMPMSAAMVVYSVD